MRKKFVIPKAGVKVNIAKSYRTYLGKLMSKGSYHSFNFFADILSGLKTQEDANTPTFSIGVHNGHYLMKYNPDMVDKLDEFGAGCVIAHELGHPALSHHARMIRLYDLFEETNKSTLEGIVTLVHISADYALNSWLIDECRIFSLKDLKTRIGSPTESGEYFEGTPLGSYAGIHPSDVGLPPKKSLEWYLKALSDRIESGDWTIKDIVSKSGDAEGRGQSDKPSRTGGPGQGLLQAVASAAEKMTADQLEELKKAAGIDPAEELKNLMNPAEGSSVSELADQLTRSFTRAMVEAASAVKGRGTLPGSIQQFVDELLRPPQVDWRQELKNYCRSAKPRRSFTSLSRPKRKHIRIEGVMTSEHPGKRKNPSYKIVFAIDTSASVSNSELQEIFIELRGIMSSNEGTEVTVVECDTNIGRVYELSSSSDVDTNVCGRGGTSFDPVFRWVRGEIAWQSERCDSQPDLLIYSTDGECSLPPTQIRVPQNKMLWLISSRGRVPCEGSSWGRKTDEVRGFADYGRFIKISSGK